MVNKTKEQEQQTSFAVRTSLRTAYAQLSELKREQAKKEAQEAAMAATATAAATDAAVLKQQLDSKWVPRVGDRVFVPKLNSKANVIGVGGSGTGSGQVTVTLQAGLMKLTASIDEIRKE